MFSFKILRGKLARGWQKIIHLGMRRRLTAVLVKSVVTHLNHELTRAVYELRVWLTRARSAENPFELP